MPDKVMSPEKRDGNEAGFKQSKTEITEGSTASLENLTPYNRSGSPKK